MSESINAQPESDADPRLCFVYITAGSQSEAQRISRLLLQARLAACVNIINGMSSIYWWQGRLESSTEVVLIAKTRKSLVPMIIEKAKKAHSYSCPCVVAFDIVDGNSDYLSWILQETSLIPQDD
ncbi:MAG: divalent-cation tolerance protein CutA [Chloroflexota bacterium]